MRPEGESDTLSTAKQAKNPKSGEKKRWYRTSELHFPTVQYGERLTAESAVPSPNLPHAYQMPPALGVNPRKRKVHGFGVVNRNQGIADVQNPIHSQSLEKVKE